MKKKIFMIAMLALFLAQPVTGTAGNGGTAPSGGITAQAAEITSVTDDAWKDYEKMSVDYEVNLAEGGNYGILTAREKNAVKSRIEQFKATCIRPDMTDLEKETAIVGWIVENCRYEHGGWDRATAYSCLVEGRAVCAGYADAFLHMAQACGLEARYVCNRAHAWNLVKIDGEWMHVDVLWEDPLGDGSSTKDNGYGIGNLQNRFINLTDDEVRLLGSHENWALIGR